MAVLSFQIGPDRPNFKSYCVVDPKLAVGTPPEPFRATFRPLKKSATAKNTNFASDGYNRFMTPSWVRAHGLILGKVYIVWVCAPPYSPLSSPRSRIRENSVLKFGPNLATHSGGIFDPVVFLNSVHLVSNLKKTHTKSSFACQAGPAGQASPPSQAHGRRQRRPQGRAQEAGRGSDGWPMIGLDQAMAGACRPNGGLDKRPAMA